MIRILASLFLLASSAFAATEIGSMNGAAFRIDKPDNHNGRLIVYCHGYSGAPGAFRESPLNPILAQFHDSGYAVIQSGYSTGGWAVEQALRETEALREYFINKHGKPSRTVVMGHSMGGLLTVALVERFPSAYDAGLPLCGALSPSLPFASAREFDALILFNHYFPAILGPASKPAPPSGFGGPLGKAITAAITAAPEKAEALRQWLGLKKTAEIPGLISFMASIQAELVQRTGGNPFDNRDTVYSGGPDDQSVNRGVERHAADPKSMDYMRTFVTTTGRIERPLLAVHTTYDPIVPASSPNAYRDLVQLNGKSGLFVQRWVARDGHCTMNAPEIGAAFADLVKWLDSGVRPAHGEQLPAPR
ncbi:MAG: alpha/beta hydrolase [Candidatus Solibacter sp.]|nr:alpha/beta hydrolase [Candidatus Solibacter sp.]